MSKQNINVGTGPNTGTADSIRAAFEKVNANFTELYTALGLNSDTTLNLGAFEFTGSTMSTTDSSAITIDQATEITSNLTVGGDVLPSIANGGDLGSLSKPWRSLYVSNNTIYIGGNALGVDNQGELSWNNNRIAHTGGEFITLDSLTDVNASNPANGDVLTWNGGAWVNASNSGGTANTGDVTFNGVKVIGAGTASGDGLGYSTLELVPDGTLVSDQYIVVDPTAPNHIHLRAGGTQDASTAALFLGGELNYVRTIDGNGVRLNNAQFIPDSVYFEQGTDYDSAIWSTDESGNHWIDITISDPFNPTRDATPINTAGSRFSQYPTRNSIEVFTGSSLFTVTGNGQAYTLGNPYNYRIGTVEAPPANPNTLTSLDYRLNTFNERYLYLENNTLEAYADTVNVFSGQTIDLVTGTGNIRIATDDNNSSYSWYFTAQGYLQFPQGLGPTTSKGKAGDEAGSVVVDADYIYYCHTDYTDGIADIWKRTPWSQTTW